MEHKVRPVPLNLVQNHAVNRYKILQENECNTHNHKKLRRRQKVITIVPVRIVVDEREKRSRIPGLLRQAGAVTDFAHLKVGDYVISAETAIERKTIQDLLNSVYDGRLLVPVL